MNRIQFSPPDIRDEDIEAVVNTLKSGWITTAKATKDFEKEIAKISNMDKALAVNSCTAGLELILRFLGIKEGDEVIVPAYTYTASASIINHVGAKIVMIDSYKDDYELNIEDLENLITEKTKAIIAVDIAGRIVDYDRIFEIVNGKRNIFKANNKRQENLGRIAIIADAAHSFAAEYKGKVSGSIADFTAFSFHAVKNFTSGEGGAITWTYDDGEDIYKIFNLLALHGQNKGAYEKNQLNSWEYDVIYPGYKYNMPDILGALGLSQIKRRDEVFKRRYEIINAYNEAFDKLGIKYLKHEGKDFKSSGHLYMVHTTLELEERNNLISLMADEGIATNVHYKPLPMMTAYKNLGFDIKDYPNAYNLYKSEITLPLHTVLTDEDVEYIIEKFTDLIKKFI